MDPGSAFFAATALGAVNTVNAYRPVRHGRSSILSFAAGQFTSELPLHAIAWQAAATVEFARRGCLRTKTGRAGAVLAMASWAALLRLHQEANRSGDVLEQALIEGLGPEYGKLMGGPGVTDEVRLTRRQVAFPRRGRRRLYVSTTDVAYGEHGPRNHLDIWRRPDLANDAQAPVLVQVHGGAWTMGSKKGQAHPLLTHLAERGWVCVAINYRLGPRCPWPDQIVDVLRAVAWVRANIAAYGGDPAFVAITGGSAGGHLSALAALAAGDPGFQPGFEEVDTSVQAAVPFYGVYDFTNADGTGRSDAEELLARILFKTRLADDRDRWERASPYHRVGAGAPPFFVVHGRNDSLVPIEQARAFVQRLRMQSGNPVLFAELPLAQHAFDTYSSIRTHCTVLAVERFLDVIYGEQLRARDTLMSGGRLSDAPLGKA